MVAPKISLAGCTDLGEASVGATGGLTTLLQAGTELGSCRPVVTWKLPLPTEGRQQCLRELGLEGVQQLLDMRIVGQDSTTMC